MMMQRSLRLCLTAANFGFGSNTGGVLLLGTQVASFKTAKKKRTTRNAAAASSSSKKHEAVIKALRSSCNASATKRKASTTMTTSAVRRVPVNAKLLAKLSGRKLKASSSASPAATRKMGALKKMVAVTNGRSPKRSTRGKTAAAVAAADDGVRPEKKKSLTTTVAKISGGVQLVSRRKPEQHLVVDTTAALSADSTSTATMITQKPNQLHQHPVQSKIVLSEQILQQNPTNVELRGKRVVFAGVMQLGRLVAATLAQKAGATVIPTAVFIPNASTDVMVCGDHSNHRQAMAQLMGVPTLNEAEFIRVIRSQR